MSDNAPFFTHAPVNAASNPIAVRVNERGEPTRVNQPKIIIIGLPRTGTTSVSVALLEQGLKVAHMAFTKEAFMQADAISDAPCFSDFQQLDTLFPKAKFVYLTRDLSAWVPSMQMLLSRMLPHLDDKTGRFHPILKRSFRHTFGVGDVTDPQDAAHLMACYQKHQQHVQRYFADREDVLTLDISADDSLNQLLRFLAIKPEHKLAATTHKLNETPIRDTAKSMPFTFPKLNVGRNVASWDEYKHPNKVSSNAAGPDKRKYFNYKL